MTVHSHAARVRDPERLTTTLGRVAARAARRRGSLPPPQILLRAPGFEFASGERDQTFHAASIGKLMTATLALQLVEQGTLGLDAPLSIVLPREDVGSLFTLDGVDHSSAVTIRHLLRHTSGVADYFDDRGSAPEAFRDLIVCERDHRWTPDELLDRTRRWLHPVAAPGRRFHYSDTGYVLLARAIEAAGGVSFGEQLHARVLRPAGMTRSFVMFHTAPGGGESPAEPGAAFDIAPILIGRADLSRAESLSCDWGGGGIATTLDDLLRFDTAWRSGSLLGASSRVLMTDIRHRMRPGIHYGAGMMQLRYGGFSPFLARMAPTIGHLGVTGAHLFSDGDVQLAMNFHSTHEMTRSFMTHIDLVRHTRRALR